MESPGYVYELSEHDELVLDFIHQIISDVKQTNRIDTSEEGVESRWYGISLDDGESTIAVIYGKSTAEFLLGLYQDAIVNNEEKGVQA